MNRRNNKKGKIKYIDIPESHQDVLDFAESLIDICQENYTKGCQMPTICKCSDVDMEVQFYRMETDGELDARADREAKANEKERLLYERLRSKFGTEPEGDQVEPQ